MFALVLSLLSLLSLLSVDAYFREPYVHYTCTYGSRHYYEKSSTEPYHAVGPFHLLETSQSTESTEYLTSLKEDCRPYQTYAYGSRVISIGHITHCSKLFIEKANEQSERRTESEDLEFFYKSRNKESGYFTSYHNQTARRMLWYKRHTRFISSFFFKRIGIYQKKLSHPLYDRYTICIEKGYRIRSAHKKDSRP